MAKRYNALGSIHNKVKHPHKTKKRLEIKKAMLAAKKKRRAHTTAGKIILFRSPRHFALKEP